MAVQTYKSAIEFASEEQKGLGPTNQGGLAYTIDEMRQLQRFLILGTTEGTFYVSQPKLTKYNIEAITKALDTNYRQAIDLIVAISVDGRAPRNDEAIVALAVAASHKDLDTRVYALAQLQKVCRIPTHLFAFLEIVTTMRGWGTGLKRAVSAWYLDKSAQNLARTVTKYPSRNGWTHRDVLRLVHAIGTSPEQQEVFKYIVKGEGEFWYTQLVELVKNAPQNETGIAFIVEKIRENNLPREVLPTWALNDVRVWEALLQSMPMTAMIRNLGTMSKIGLLTQGSIAAHTVHAQLTDAEALKKARVHPIDVLKAKLTYQQGHGMRSDARWMPVQSVVNDLEGAFYTAFDNVEPTNKSLLLALDVSSSMTQQLPVGIPGMTAAMGTAALALVTARTEPFCETIAFSNNLMNFPIGPHDSLESVMRRANEMNFGGTYIDLPIRYAEQNKTKYDAFVIFTDNENGSMQNPAAVLKNYRRQVGPSDAKLIVNAMVSNRYSVADPTDPNMLDVVGFDTAVPTVMRQFILNEV